jgi:hypothetical protein
MRDVAAVADRGGAVIECLPDNDAHTPTAVNDLVNDRGYTRRLPGNLPGLQ